MKNLKNYLMIMCLVILFFNCNSDDTPFFENTRTISDAVHDFKQLKFTNGINDMEIEGSFSNLFWNFRVIIPEVASEINRRPLIVCLHGGTSIIDPDLHKYTNCLEEPGFSNIDAFLLCPNSEGFSWNGIPEQEKVLTLTDLVKSNLFVDPDKVVIMGYSDGGNGAWFYAKNHPSLFSAAIPISSSYGILNPQIEQLKINIPMYVIHGELDQLFPLEGMRRVTDVAIEAGTKLSFVIANGLDHYNSCMYVPYLKDAAMWLENEVWN